MSHLRRATASRDVGLANDAREIGVFQEDFQLQSLLPFLCIHLYSFLENGELGLSPVDKSSADSDWVFTNHRL